MKEPIKLLAIIAAALFVSMLMFTSLASATIVNLRPNADISIDRWTITGASTAWDALNEGVTEAQTPSGGDYISVSPQPIGVAEVGLTTTPIAGASALTATAWYYTPDSGDVELEVRNGVQKLGLGESSSKGWHSVSTSLSTQQQLDNASLLMRPASSGGTKTVYAAFLRLSFTPATPKLYWGARMDGETYGLSGDAPWESKAWDLFEEDTQKAASIVHFGQPAPWLQSFAKEPLELTSKRGAIPLMSMGSEEAAFSELEKGGAKEGSLKTWAKAVNEYEKPFFFRWDWEMNLLEASNLPWAKKAHADPAAFVRAWRNFHDIAEAEGATNITWVWCPNVSFPGSTSLKSLYPGNAYVDWTCIDGYNRGTKAGGSWTSFKNVFSTTYQELTSAEFEGHSKPIMIGETASTESGGSKAEWIAEAIGTNLPNSFPAVKALVWFNWNITDGGTKWDWPIESSAAAQASFANAIGSPYYAANTFGGLTPLAKVQPLP